jgi:hypothetical protein
MVEKHIKGTLPHFQARKVVLLHLHLQVYGIHGHRFKGLLQHF